MKSFYSYPDGIQEKIQADEKLSTMIPKKSTYITSFISNYMLFTTVFLIIGFLLRIDGLWNNIRYFLIVGIGLNLFDLLCVDILWWRNTKRTRFKGLDASASEYKNPNKHVMAFGRGIPVFVCAAITVGFLLNRY